MTKSKNQLINLTSNQLKADAQKKGKSKTSEYGFKINEVEPIPDHDWVGETWGLYFSDYEEELLKILEQEPEKYIRKHPVDKWQARCSSVVILTCPAKQASPSPPPPPSPSPPPPPAPSPPPSPPVTKIETVLDIHPPLEPLTLETVVFTAPERKIARLTDCHDATVRNVNNDCQSRDLSVTVSTVKCEVCPPSSPPPPAKKLKDNAQQLGLPDIRESEEEMAEIVVVAERSSKWDWMKEDAKMGSHTKHRMSLYW